MRVAHSLSWPSGRQFQKASSAKCSSRRITDVRSAANQATRSLTSSRGRRSKHRCAPAGDAAVAWSLLGVDHARHLVARRGRGGSGRRGCDRSPGGRPDKRVRNRNRGEVVVKLSDPEVVPPLSGRLKIEWPPVRRGHRGKGGTRSTVGRAGLLDGPSSPDSRVSIRQPRSSGSRR
jgi:hypothetical protein